MSLTIKEISFFLLGAAILALAGWMGEQTSGDPIRLTMVGLSGLALISSACLSISERREEARALDDKEATIDE